MKTINIEGRRKKQISFEVCLGNGLRKQFTSQRNLKQFVADTNRYLTKCLVVLNHTYIDALREYRLVWFVTANTNSGTKTYYRETEERIKGNLQAAEFCFDKFNATWGGSNDPFFAFIDLRKIAVFLKDSCLLMETFHKKRNNTAAMYTAAMLADRCQSVINKMQDYGTANQ